MVCPNSVAVAAAANLLGTATLGQGLVLQSHRSFVGRELSSSGRPFCRRRRPSRGTAMYLDDAMPNLPILIDVDVPSSSSPPLPAPESTALLPANPFTATSKFITSNPVLEVELLDVSNAALDVSTLLGPNKVWLRLYNVLGRVLVLSTDAIRDVRVPLDEWAFHAAMLAVALHLFLRSAQPLLLAACSVDDLSVRDRRAYALLFEAVGLTVLQFKALLSSRTLEWVNFAPNEVAELKGDMYFLYCGDVAVSTITNQRRSNAEVALSVPADHVADEETLDVSDMVFGDVQFAQALEASLQSAAPSKGKAAKAAKGAAPDARIVAGARGAAALRISRSKLLRRMGHDDELSRSIQRLVLRCMQGKLRRMLPDGGWTLSSKKCGR